MKFLDMFSMLCYIYILVHSFRTLISTITHKEKVNFTINESITLTDKNFNLFLISSILNIVFAILAAYFYFIAKIYFLSPLMIIFFVVNMIFTRKKLSQLT